MSDHRKPIADQMARDEALDVARSFIVRAPAGSGKTHLLIQRFLGLLVTVDEPEEIIAITFTRKAAAEMRERVLSALAEAEDNADSLDDVTRRLATKALARDKERQWQLAANASRLRIQTIDALNASITRQMPLASRFGAQPETTEDANALYLEAARALLAQVNDTGDLATNIGVLLRHLDNNLPVAENLLADMLRSRDQWLRNLSGMSEREVLEAALRRARASAIAEVVRRFPVGVKDDTLALARFAARNKPDNRTGAGDWPLESIERWPGADDASLTPWLGIAEMLLTDKGEWRKRAGINKRNGFPVGEGNEKAEFAAAKERVGDLLERMGGETSLARALDKLRGLPPAHYTDAEWQALGAIVRLLLPATGMLWATFSAHGKCDFTQVAQSASVALGTDDAPSDLALALDYRIRHLLVDEFQDTSVTQFELLEKLTRGWTAGDGRTLFVVGDPMQSIYRFREAEVKLFGRAARDGIGTVELAQLQLSVNFRSQPEVVTWVNAAFSALMPKDADASAEAGQVPYAASVAFSDGSGGADAGVTWHPQLVRSTDVEAGVATDAADDEACTVVNIIRQTIKEIDVDSQKKPNVKRERVALLVRNRGHLAKIVPALKTAGIVFQAVDIDPLKERPVVQDLLALTRALLHPADRIAWLAILRAPWCGLTLNDLVVLVRGAQVIDGALVPDPRTVWEIINEESRVALLSNDGRARLERLREVLAPVVNVRRRQPLRELVECSWLALSGPACLAAAGELDDAVQMLDLLETEAVAQTGGSHIVDLEQLDARVEKLFAGNRSPESCNTLAVQIMTIHKAKGLEFDTVIVPGLHRMSRQDAPKLMVWAEQTTPGPLRQELLLAPIREAGVIEDSNAIYRFVQQHGAERQQEEDVRLLYVAATRAKRKLHLLATVKVKEATEKAEEKISPPRARTLLASLWPVAGDVFAERMGMAEFIQQTVASSIDADAGTQRSALRLLRSQRLPSMPASISFAAPKLSDAPTAVIDFEWAGETARHIGTVVHGFLQRIADEGLASWNRERIAAAAGMFDAELRRLGVASAELPVAAARVAEALIKTLDDERGRWVLADHSQAKSEWRLSGVISGGIINVAIDRTFVDSDGVRWIIDYKTGGHEGGDLGAFLDNEQKRYRGQLESYAALLQHLPSARAQDVSTPPAIRLGLYFPQLRAWREWALEDSQ